MLLDAKDSVRTVFRFVCLVFMLCFGMVCYVMLFYVMLCYAMLCYVYFFCLIILFYFIYFYLFQSLLFSLPCAQTSRVRLREVRHQQAAGPPVRLQVWTGAPLLERSSDQALEEDGGEHPSTRVCMYTCFYTTVCMLAG